MLVAEKQLLDANLRNDLQQLRRLELKMLVNRFSTAVPAATMIGGFTFTGVVEIDLLEPSYVDHDSFTRLLAGLFHVFGALALSASIYALTVCSLAIVLGQRLAVQATVGQTKKHEQNVKELSFKFNTVLFSIAVSLSGVVGASLCAIWARFGGEFHTAIVATALFVLVLPFIAWSTYTMNLRLNEQTDESSTVKLRTEKGSLDISEFRVGDSASIPSKSDIETAMGVTALKAAKPDERSSLLKCVQGASSKAV